MSRFEITFAEWEACRLDRGCNARAPSDNRWGRGRRPVINVSRLDAEQYSTWLSRKTMAAYRLPSESEWIFAAAAGSRDARARVKDLSSQRANFDDSVRASGSYHGRTKPVGSYAANRFGLHDMFGNVAEWVQEGWAKGGSWYDDRAGLGLRARLKLAASARQSIVGIRLVRELAK